MTLDTLTFLQSLIRCRSVTPEDDGAQALVKEALTKLGFDIYDLPFDGRDSYAVENFFARRGDTGPHLCFAGHTDVVPVGDEKAWSSPPFEAKIIDNHVIGRGASDMKGSVAAFVSALSSYLENHNPNGSISLIITGDEEKHGINGSARVLEWMAENNHIPDVCLVGEPTNPDTLGQEIKPGRRGSLTGVLSVQGRQGHTAYPALADNPLPRLIKLLDVLNEAVFDLGSEFFPATNLEVTTIDVGNTAHNVIPEKARSQFNVRFSDQWKGIELEAEIRRLLDAVTSEYDLDIRIGAESFLTPSGPWTDLVGAAVKKVTGNTPALTTNGGTSDARFIHRYCPVVECGPINKTIHQTNESIELGVLDKLTEIYQEILSQYFQ